MKFKMYHSSIDVLDLDRSLEFYKKAMGLEVMREIDTGSDERRILYIGTPDNPGCMLELNWYRDRTEPYDLGEGEIHMGIVTDKYDEYHAKHKEMGVICFENEMLGVYFIEDPDGYWLEIIPARD